MTDTPELTLLRETLLSIYRDVAPDHSVGAEFLVRKLAAQLYQRGARLMIGDSIAAPEVTIHHSVDPDMRLVWTCKYWNQTMGHRNGAMSGHHISEILTPESWARLRDQYWPELMQTGRVVKSQLNLVTRMGETLPARGRTDVLRDSAGAFLRTFAKIKTRIPLLAPLLFAAGALTTDATLLARKRPAAQPAIDQPIRRRGVLRLPKVYVLRHQLDVRVVGHDHGLAGGLEGHLADHLVGIPHDEVHLTAGAVVEDAGPHLS